ncbi:MAG TPA: ATP-dependent zinc metalloprotease FtsH, partial [Pirellulaceae bacterium]|nr:ATP-dependent zinc metalloprotease FtsH [Pirellulaceae bacterium]
MSRDDSGSRRGGDGKSAPSGPPVLWYVVAAVVGLLAVGWMVVYANQQVLDYSDLLRLIERSKRVEPRGELAADAPGVIEIEATNRTTKKVRRFIRFSNLRNVIVGEKTVIGLVDRELVEYSGEGDASKEERRQKEKDVKFISNRMGNDSENAHLMQALDDNNIDYSIEQAPSLMRQYLPAFLLTTLIITFFVLALRRLGGVGSPMQFGRSRGKLYALEDLGVTFNDVAGIDEAVEEVREVVDFLRSPDKYQKLGGRIPKGVLLVGPPGTGKTLLAKAIAGEAGVPFFSLSGSDFVEMFVGVGAARVRDMFQQAEAKAPCIIFIDELDALGKSRGSGMVGGHDEREQTLNALLVEMDGFASNSGVIVMAATNRPETLDPALLRPGRFDRHVLVDRPDIRGREAILKVHVKNVRLDPTVELTEVASLTPGFVGADLANLVNEAALLAARNNKQSVGMKEFNEGVERVTAGLEKKQRVMNEDEKLRVAYHESGHALVAYSLPNTDPVHKVSIIPRGLAALGYTMQRPEGDRYLMTQAELESRIQVLLAGTLAEEIVFRDISTGAQNDLERATEIARSMVMDYGMSRLGRVNYRESNRSVFLAGAGDERAKSHSEQTAREIDLEVKRIIDESLEKVRHILETRSTALESLTRRLIDVESVDAVELKRIVEEATPG